MLRKHEDNILLKYRYLYKAVHDIRLYFDNNQDESLSGFNFARYEAHKTALALYEREVGILDLQVTWAEYCDAREYYSRLSIQELQESYELAVAKDSEFSRNGFEYWLVCEVCESRFCKYHDC